MDVTGVLHEAFGPDDVPSQAAENRARAALQQRMSSREPRVTSKDRRHRIRFAITAGVAVAAAAAVVAAVAVTRGDDHAPAPKAAPATSAVLPFARPASAAEYLENAAWTAERRPWTDPRPDQFMYIETLELRNKPAYENQHPNDPIRPGQGETRKIQEWNSVDGQTRASYRDGRLVVTKRGEGGDFFDRIAWSTITSMTDPDTIPDGVPGPGSMGVNLDAFIGQYVVPPNVQAAIFRHLARKPEMTVNPDAVNIDGRPAVGLGRIIEGYLSQELLFDKQTYQFIGERMVAIKDHVTHGDDGDAVIHRGDVYRQIIYAKMIIVDRPGDTR
ncbi:CU044_5270 family protein [Dactylosporangium sp. CA-233914]|uniref:CU044_5270 family protein n=1 Tax=Dactylosporangium sp. CA-233914 TaxID=3239934 RepID=UPI003D89C841